MLALFKPASGKFPVQRRESLVMSFVNKPHRAHSIVGGNHNDLTQRRLRKSIYQAVHSFNFFTAKIAKKFFSKKIVPKIWFIK